MKCVLAARKKNTKDVVVLYKKIAKANNKSIDTPIIE